MSDRELKKTIKAFYRNFTDVFLETFKLISISEKELIRRASVKNIEVLNDRLERGESVIALTSHYCNWEWLLASCSLQLKYSPDAVYLRVKNPFFEKLMLKIRSRFGAHMIEKKYVLSEGYRRQEMTRVIAMVADQAPKGERSLKWLKFLNQDTAFINGPERISRILHLPVIYCKMSRTSRGFYEIEFVEVESSPGQSNDPGITEKFGSILEETILECPPNWLWSHNRWKQSKPVETAPASI